MSWFKRLRTFVEDEDILADDYEAEFDGIAAALNGFVRGDQLTASGVLSLGSEQDIPGTEETIDLPVASLVHVTAFFDFDIKTGSFAGKSGAQGLLNVDGSNQSAVAEIGSGSSQRNQATVGETFLLRLAPGSHILKLRARAFTEGPIVTGSCWPQSTRYSYLIFPDPEP